MWRYENEDGYRVNADGAWVENGVVMAWTLEEMAIAMEERNGNEKYYYLPESLLTDTREIGMIHERDLMLFGFDCLVLFYILFYKDFQASYHYTRLGCVKNREGLSCALGRGSATVTFR